MSFNLKYDKGELFNERKVLHKVDEGRSRAHPREKVLHKVVVKDKAGHITREKSFIRLVKDKAGHIHERKVLHKVDEGQSRAHPREKSPS
ncbi:hypothetical protein CJ195_10620 [Bacillus sp. UMB0899]|nr:hypothetical protein CJ195_10620 [Bacillus sp. UMB0899]